MEILKSHWESGHGKVRLSVPIMKVDQERRTVSGFATLNNLDRQGDIVLAQASKEAFAAWPGNVREMHANIAAGKVLSFREETFFDPDTEKIYDGIYVDVYVSKGAQPTWEKVLDGTLSGFSIGGIVKESEPFYDSETGATINLITKYELYELSLVDSPANQLANIFSVMKNANGEAEVSGIAVNVETVDVYWCSEDNVATIGKSECSACGNSDSSIGWIESTGSEAEKAQAISDLIKNAAKPAVLKEEGVEKDMADVTEEVVEKAAETPEVAEVAEVSEVEIEKADSDDTAEEVTAEADVEVDAVEKAESAEDEVSDAPEAAVEETIDYEARFNELASQIAQVAEAFAGMSKAIESISEKVVEVSKTVSDADEKSATALEALGERIGGVEKAVAGKKSADREVEEPVVKQRDIWADRFTVRGLR